MNDVNDLPIPTIHDRLHFDRCSGSIWWTVEWNVLNEGNKVAVEIFEICSTTKREEPTITMMMKFKLRLPSTKYLPKCQ